jgi:hypothetical protein
MARRFNLQCALCTSALALTACGEVNHADNSASSAGDLEVAMNALENPIISCQLQAGECVQKASDLMALQACQAGIGDCLRAAGERIQKIADGLTSCREEERKCVGTKGGSCFAEFQKCVQSLAPEGDAGTPSTPSGDAGVALDAGSSVADAGSPPPPSEDGGDATAPTPPTVDAGRPGFPSFPGLGDGGRPGLPSFPGLLGGGASGQPAFGGAGQLPGADCLTGLRECAAKPGADLFDCASEARECLRSAAPSPFPLP